MKTVKELKEQLSKNYKDTDEIMVAYWDREWVECEFSVFDIELTDKIWEMFKRTLLKYTKHNGLSSDLISEVVSEVISENNLDEREEVR